MPRRRYGRRVRRRGLPVLRIEREGRGRLRAAGPVLCETPHGVVTGDAGTVRW